MDSQPKGRIRSDRPLSARGRESGSWWDLTGTNLNELSAPARQRFSRTGAYAGEGSAATVARLAHG